MTTFTVASNEFIGGGKEKSEYQVKARVYPRAVSLMIIVPREVGNSQDLAEPALIVLP